MSSKTELVEKLNCAIEALNAVTRENKRFHMSHFLHQSIALYANEETLIKIIADVEKHTNLRKAKLKKSL